tara:strand:- start:222 stop:1007 length:786 start_codon:yes stop_codon:yes gene_type:complete
MKYSPKDIKMAIGVASDKRYAGGNMTGAVKAIEKIKKGLSSHPQVAAVLKRQNEQKMKTFDELTAELAEGKAANPAQQAAIAIAKKEKEKSVKERTEADCEGMVCKNCGDKFGMPTEGKCMYDSKDPNGENWMQKVDEANELDEAQKLFMFTSKAEAQKKAKQIGGKVLELKRAMDGNMFAVIHKDLTKKPATEGKKMDSAAMKRAMDAFKKRGGKIKKVAPGKAAGYHGKDDPGADVQGMMDRGDTKGFNRKKKVKSMGK